MEKGTLIKIFVLLLTLAFLLEYFAFGTPVQPGSGNRETPFQDAFGTPAAAPLYGTAEANATVLSYPDGVIMLSGRDVTSDPALSERLIQLSEEGKVSYTNAASPDLMNVILAPGADLAQVALNLSLDFPQYQPRAKALLSLPPELLFLTSRGNVSARAGQRISLFIDPITAVGQNTTLLVGATIADGAVSGLQAEPAKKSGLVLVPATVTELRSEWFIEASFPWELRPANESEAVDAVRSVYPNLTYYYEEAPIIVIGNASEEQKAAVRNLSYVIATVSMSAVVENGFRNRSLAEADLRGILGENATLVFPDSVLSINITADSVDERSLSSALEGSELSIRRVALLSVPRFVEVEGGTYLAPPGIVLERAVLPNATVGESMEVVAKITTNGPRIVSIE